MRIQKKSYHSFVGWSMLADQKRAFIWGIYITAMATDPLLSSMVPEKLILLEKLVFFMIFRNDEWSWEGANDQYDVSRKILVKIQLMSSRAQVKCKLYKPNTCWNTYKKWLRNKLEKFLT